jgi:hypothetical protein
MTRLSIWDKKVDDKTKSIMLTPIWIYKSNVMVVGVVSTWGQNVILNNEQPWIERFLQIFFFQKGEKILGSNLNANLGIHIIS